MSTLSKDPITPQEHEKLEKMLNREVPEKHKHSHYLRWIRHYLTFRKTSPSAARDIEPFLEHIKQRHPSPFMNKQARHAVNIYHQMLVNSVSLLKKEPIPAVQNPLKSEFKKPDTQQEWDKVLSQQQFEIKVRHYAPRTLKNYTHWAKRFQRFVKSTSPQNLDESHVRAFLGSLAIEHNLAASTQNQAFNALLFFFKHGIKRPLQDLKGIPRAKRKKKPPVLLSKKEVHEVLNQLSEDDEQNYKLIVQLLYGCGLRLKEVLNIRLQDLDFDNTLLYVRRGKGNKDRVLPLPQVLLQPLRKRLLYLKKSHLADLENADYGGVFLPDSVAKKDKGAAKSLSWQWLFPAILLTYDEDAKCYKRFHLHESHVQKNVKKAVGASDLVKRVSPHTFRHAFASHLLQAGYDLQTIQQLLGHSDIRTTMIYLHTRSPEESVKVRSPLDYDLSS